MTIVFCRRKTTVRQMKLPIQSPTRKYQWEANRSRRHPAMHRIKTVRRTEKISWRFARTTDTRQLNHTFRLDAHLITGTDDALRNRIVPTASAQRSLSSPINFRFQTKPISFLFRLWCCFSHSAFPSPSTSGLWTPRTYISTTTSFPTQFFSLDTLPAPVFPL